MENLQLKIQYWILIHDIASNKLWGSSTGSGHWSLVWIPCRGVSGILHSWPSSITRNDYIIINMCIWFVTKKIWVTKKFHCTVLFKIQCVWNEECIDRRHVLDHVGVRFLGGTVSGILRTKNLCYILNWVRNLNIRWVKWESQIC